IYGYLSLPSAMNSRDQNHFLRMLWIDSRFSQRFRCLNTYLLPGWSCCLGRFQNLKKVGVGPLFVGVFLFPHETRISFRSVSILKIINKSNYSIQQMFYHPFEES
ncbi:mCG145287, partial [Mus musculus]